MDLDQRRWICGSHMHKKLLWHTTRAPRCSGPLRHRNTPMPASEVRLADYRPDEPLPGEPLRCFARIAGEHICYRFNACGLTVPGMQKANPLRLPWKPKSSGGATGTGIGGRPIGSCVAAISCAPALRR
jgi:hypothetical protein